MSNQLFVDLLPEQQQLLVGGEGEQAQPKAKNKVYFEPTITIPIKIGPIAIPEIKAEVDAELTTK
ncbi:MAG TPA: hypothetical protein VK203_10250 [Nostocaceae cyanobacterium]|nr:hypothetical protein [Nostocaceae cyanobacterium]